MATIRLKRAYEKPAKSDGLRILVERLWPRGVTKEAALIDQWMKEAAPSPALRQWYAHDPEKWPEFQRRYRKELVANKDAIAALRKLTRASSVTFVFAAKDAERSSAAVLKAYLEGRRKPSSRKKASRIAPGG